MEILIDIFQVIGVLMLTFFMLLAMIAGLAFFFLRRKYLKVRELYRGKKNFFSVIIFPFIDWVFNAWNYADKGGEYKKSLYHYTPKKFFLTKPEHDCFNMLMEVVGDTYHVFPQVKMDKFLDEHVKGQKWTVALRHINQKSVDFLLCDKVYLNPKLAIELDDATHNLPDRIEQDHEVERILKDAGFPLLRLTHADTLSVEIIKLKISESIR